MSGAKALKRLAQRIGWGRVFGAAVLAAFLALGAANPLPLQLLRLKVFDLYQTLKPRVPKSQPVVIVDIDEPSLEKYRQWPWERTLVAKLVDRITAGGAVTIGFDIVFPEPDRTSPALLAEAMPDLSEAARAEIRQAPDHDAVLAATLARSRVVLGQSAYNPRKGEKRKGGAPKASFALLSKNPETSDPKRFLIEYPELLPNIPVLENAAAGRGMFTVVPDADGVVRRVPMVLVANGELVPSLTADMLRVATGQTTYVLKSDETGITSLIIGRVPVPTDERGQLWLHFGPRRADRFVSAADVLDGTVSPERFRGKLVLIGTSATGLVDIRATPIDPVMSGVEIHAQILESILDQTLLARPAYAIGAELVVAFLVGLAIIMFAPILGALTTFALGLGVAVLLAGGSWYAFLSRGLLLDAAFPLVSSFAVFVTMLSVNYLREEARRQQIRDAFGQYLSPALVEQLAENPDKLVLGGETREMTVLFSDVRGFTSISESYKQDPQGLTALMNRFLTPLSHAVMEHRGTIDKYMGDNIMAFWNAPLEDEHHARHACAAALEMLERLKAINAERETEAKAAGQPFVPLNMGVGINTGHCVVGNMGSDVRFDYSVLGDSVNLASRFEGQSKIYGVPTIIGSATAVLIGDAFATLELDAVRVMGKKEPEVICTLLGPKDGADAARYQAARAAMAAVLAAYRKQDWAGAMKALRAARKVDGGIDLTGLCDLYAARIKAFRKNPPPQGWDGVHVAETK